MVGYLLAPARRRGGQSWIKLGPLTSFPEGETRLAIYENPFRVAWDGATAKIACWVRRVKGDQFQIFAINCAHLGCPVRWFAQSRLFMCPCHGGAYYEDGVPRLRAAAPGALRVRVPGPRRPALGARRSAPDPVGAGVSWRPWPGSARSASGSRSARGSARDRAGASPIACRGRTASWWYMFGSATLALFVLQIATGICLALVYVPSADKAYESLQYLNYQAPFGWYLRAVHFWGSNAMVAVMTLHMIQVFLWGAHKYPREMTWVVGVLLFLCTLGMAFTGQILRWDQDAYWGLGIGASIAVPHAVIGESVVHVLLGGPIIAGRTLSRVLHRCTSSLIPGLLIALVGLHLWLVLRLGINEWPMPGRLVDRETYRQRYEEEVAQGRRARSSRTPRARTWCRMGVVVLLVLRLRGDLRPHGPHGVPDPTIIDTAPKPDFYFLALFALFALLPPWTETVLLLVGPPDRDRAAPGRAVHRGHRREELEAPAGRGARRDPDRPHRDHARRARPRRPVVAGHGRVERGCRRRCAT